MTNVFFFLGHPWDKDRLFTITAFVPAVQTIIHWPSFIVFWLLNLIREKHSLSCDEESGKKTLSFLLTYGLLQYKVLTMETSSTDAHSSNKCTFTVQQQYIYLFCLICINVLIPTIAFIAILVLIFMENKCPIQYKDQCRCVYYKKSWLTNVLYYD